MKIDFIQPELAIEQGAKLPFAFIRSLSSVTIGKTPKIINLDELLEARFFDEHCEIRIFLLDETLCATRLEEEPDDKILRAEYRLNPHFGSSITIYRCLDTHSDEDGQTFVSTVRLAGWRESQ